MDMAGDDEGRVEDRPGWLDAAGRVLKQLLRSPRFKADVRSILNQIDPGYAAGLVKTAVWTDPSISMAALAALPRAANALILGAEELITQSERFPPALLANFLRDTLGQIKLDTLGRVAGRMTGLSLKLAVEQQDWSGLARQYTAGFASALPPDALADAVVDAASLAERIVGDHPDWIRALSGAVERILKQHPKLVDEALVPLLAPVLAAVEQRGGGGQA
jgi:hypothetical protein